jgi:anti-sigma factor RsiW
MNENKMRKLFDAARSEPAPGPGEDFPAQVMRAVRREPAPEPPSVFGQLGDLFPRLAVAAVVLIALCVVGDFCASALDQSDLTSGVAQLSEQWLFATKGF